MAEVDFQKLSFQEAIDFFRGKINQDTNDWQDVWRDEHDTQFMVAGAKGALLQDFRQAVDRAIAEGSSLEEFKKQFDQIVQRHGWSYRGSRDWRATTIYSTNLRTAYAAGRYQQMTDPETLKRRPYWEWRHGDSRVPRPLHKALDGRVFPAGSPFWDSMFPPVGFGCRCKVFALSERDLRRMGKDAPDTPPAVGGYLDYTDPQTGQIASFRVQADPGWDYAPGKSLQGQGGSLSSPWADKGNPERRQQILNRLDPQLQQAVIRSTQPTALEQEEARIVLSPVEIGVVFDKEGNKLFERTGVEDAIDWTPAEEARMRDRIVTHNHPAPRPYGDGSIAHNIGLSDSDVEEAAKIGLAEMRAVTRDYVYSMKPGKQGWPKPEDIMAEFEKVDAWLWPSALSQYEAGLMSWAEINEFFYDQIWDEVANRMGLDYAKTRR